MEVPVVGAVIDAIVGASVENLISLLKEEFNLITGVEKDVENLVSVLSTIQAVLKDAEEQQIKNNQISDWLWKLKDATYDAEDVLDAWAFKIQDHNRTKAATTSSTNIFSCFRPSRSTPNIKFRHEIAKEIQEVIIKFDEIAKEKEKFHLNTGVVLHSESQYRKDRETSSRTYEPHIYGVEENVTKIIDILVNTSVNQDDVSVYPIVGMGGLGKTTLAQSVYNDERVQRHFELKKWVCVSEPFDVMRILQAITGTSTPGTLEDVRTEVEKILRQKRYLLVLDDVWNDKQDQWDKLKSFLKGGAKGSSVVLTTRSSGVAYITGTIEPCLLGRLSDDDCFFLFKHHALGDRNKELHRNLAAIGKQIAEKCKGVPLVAKSLGSLLRFKTSEEQWELVRDSDIWTLNETVENTVLAALRLSYNHLSSRLTQCFAYCAIFPKDSVMKKSKLINLWIANGFIPCQGKMELEEVGDDVFNELLRLSFFQEPKTDDTTTCKMHDLMHDLASYVAKNECLIAKLGETKDIPKTIRHLSVVCDPQAYVHLFSSPPSLRTLSFFHSHTTDLDRSFQFSSTLRVLDLSLNFFLVSLPLSLCKLKCLRYLDLSRCFSITSLPEGLGSMSSLRHLDLSYCHSITSLPVGIGKLTCLETLNLFVVGNWLSDGDNGGGGASISELQGLNQLRGLLTIRGLENVRNGKDAKEANLSSKTHLSGLELWWRPREDVNNNKEVLEGLLWLPLNNNITSLTILNYKAAYFPEVFQQNLKSLKSLHIWGCDELVSLPEGLLQKLTSLKKLVISNCSRLKSLGCTWTQGDSNPNTSSSSASSSSHFHSSSLQELSIECCPELQFSDKDFHNLDALCSLTLGDLPQLTALPQGIQHLPMLQRLEIRGCENLRIFPAWVNRREKDKGEDWHFICRDSYFEEFAPEFGPEEDANEPATEEIEQVNNDKNTIVGLVTVQRKQSLTIQMVELEATTEASSTARLQQLF